MDSRITITVDPVAGPSSSSTAGPSSSSRAVPTSAVQVQKICKFFKWGSCRYGTACRYAHIATSSTETTATVGDLAQNCIPSTSTTVPNLTNSAAINSTKIDPLKWVNASAFIPTTKQPCGICLEVVLEKPGSEQRFGILPNCNHIFCLECIETWRKTYFRDEIKNGCPTCRVQSDFVCPSIVWVEGREKEKFINDYKTRKPCGICLKNVLEKPGSKRRFGILPNCNHVFCLECILTCRESNYYGDEVKIDCPTCRVQSDFVCTSIVWVEGRQKEKFINDYKKACKTITCKYFKLGYGECPFGNKCLYKHARITGELVNVVRYPWPSSSRLREIVQITAAMYR